MQTDKICLVLVARAVQTGCKRARLGPRLQMLVAYLQKVLFSFLLSTTSSTLTAHSQIVWAISLADTVIYIKTPLAPLLCNERLSCSEGPRPCSQPSTERGPAFPCHRRCSPRCVGVKCPQCPMKLLGCPRGPTLPRLGLGESVDKDRVGMGLSIIKVHEGLR